MKKYYMDGNKSWYLQAFQNFESRLNGQKTTEFHRLRKNAIQSFHNTGFPSTRDEEWKYTDITSLTDRNFEIVSPDEKVTLNVNDFQHHQFEDLEEATAVFINGFFNADFSNLQSVSDKIRITSLREAIDRNDQNILNLLTRQSELNEESFVSLNTAFMEDGIIIEVDNQTIIHKPLHLLFLNTDIRSPYIISPRIHINVGESSQISFIENYASLGNPTNFTNSVADIYIGKNSQVERYKIQNESLNAYHISNLKVSQKRDSRFIDLNFNLGSKLARNNIATIFLDENAESILNGLYVAGQEQLIDNHTSINHAKPHCESFELYKGILDDKARGVFNGKIFVQPDAQKTNAIQSNNCILLSDTATIDTKPQLEIFADDVKCTHGATIGQLNDEAFFYMRSRGIEKTRARNLLIYAFASEVLDKIESETIRNRVSEHFANKLHSVRPVL